MKAIAHGTARFLLPAALIGMLLAGCDEAPGQRNPPGSANCPAPDTSSGSADLGGVTLQITLDLTGAITLHGNITTQSAISSAGQRITSCADYAKGGTDSSGKPQIQLPTVITTSAHPIQGHQVPFTNQLTPYHGPGGYQRGTLSGQGGAATVEIDHKAYALASPECTANTEIHADGSSQFTFADSQADESCTLSGTVTWTCTS